MDYYLMIGGLPVKLTDFPKLQITEETEQFLTGRTEAALHYRMREEIFPLHDKRQVYATVMYKVYEDETYWYRLIDGNHKNIVLQRKKADPSVTEIYARKAELADISHLLLQNYLALEEPLLWKDAFLLHASLIRWKGEGIVFSAPSGTGKSTQAELWERWQNAEILNGDRALIRQKEDGFHVYGSMFAGSSKICKDESARLSAVVILEQAETNTLRRLSGRDAFIRLYSQILQNPWNPDYAKRLSQKLESLIQELPVLLLRCRPDRESTEIVKEYIQSGKNLL